VGLKMCKSSTQLGSVWQGTLRSLTGGSSISKNSASVRHLSSWRASFLLWQSSCRLCSPLFFTSID